MNCLTSPVQVVGGDVVEDSIGKVAVMTFARGDARYLAMHFLANRGGTDVDVEAGQEMERCSGSGGIAQRAGAQFNGGDWRGKARFKREACGQCSGQVCEVLSRARGNDEWSEERNF